MSDIVIIDYHSGNLHSTLKAFEKAAKPLGLSVAISNDPANLDAASHIVLPGVGAFTDCMNGLRSIDGLLDALKHNVIEQKKPFLGICVGMQLLAKVGYEHGEQQGLGWLDAVVRPLRDKVIDPTLKIPHMGWNTVDVTTEGALTQGLKADDHVYYVHSYYMEVNNAQDMAASSTHGIDFPAMVSQGNIHGTQFHPEKSQQVGALIIHNFLSTRQE